MYNHVLLPVAVNHADSTDAALAAAKLLAGDTGKVTGLTVVEPFPVHVEVEIPPTFLEETRGRALKHLKEVIGPKADPIIVLGHAARSITEYAENNGVDCIVIASHQPGFSDIFLGSTAAHVVRHAKCAVHVVR